jgi:hypothetical protein
MLCIKKGWNREMKNEELEMRNEKIKTNVD